jgi:integrase
MAKRRQYGTGSIRKRGDRLYIRWYDSDGNRQEEAAGADASAAKRLLQQRIGEAAAGAKIKKAGADVTVRDCLDLLLADYKRRGAASYRIAGWKVRGVIQDLIGARKVSSFDWESAWAYIEQRRKTVKPSTINRELSLLRKAFALASSPEHSLIAAPPRLPESLDEGDNVRTGFLTPSQYDAVLKELPEYLRPLACVAYYTGLRKSTLLGLLLESIDLDSGLIWISRSKTKNRKQHAVPILPGQMRAFIDMALAANHKYIFERDGQPIRSFRTAWLAAVERAGVPSLLFHDFRRTAVRDWIASGASESAAMAISGHKTRSMLDRYNILDAAAIQRAAALRSEQPTPELGEKRGKEVLSKPS